MALEKGINSFEDVAAFKAYFIDRLDASVAIDADDKFF